MLFSLFDFAWIWISDTGGKKPGNSVAVSELVLMKESQQHVYLLDELS